MAGESVSSPSTSFHFFYCSAATHSWIWWHHYLQEVLPKAWLIYLDSNMLRLKLLGMGPMAEETSGEETLCARMLNLIQIV